MCWWPFVCTCFDRFKKDVCVRDWMYIHLWNYGIMKPWNYETIMTYFCKNDHNSIRDQEQTRWRGPRELWILDRWNNQDIPRRDVFASPVASVQGQSPSERSESTREVPNFSSENFPSNVLFEKLCSIWRRKTTGFNLPPS